MDYVLHLSILAMIYVGAAQALNLCVGQAGLISLAHAALFGLGAYVSAILSQQHDLPFALDLAAACAAAGLAGFVLAAVCARLRGDYFAIVTLAIQIVALAVCKNADAVTGGAVGLYNILPARIWHWEFSSKASVLLLAATAALLAVAICHAIRRSQWGLALHVAREDVELAETFAQRVGPQRAAVLAVSGGLIGAFGALYAHYTGYVSPDTFGLGLSILLLSMVVIGGPGTSLGPTVGAVLLLLLPEALRVIPVLDAHLAELRNAIGAVLLLGCLLVRPRGLIAGFDFTTHSED